MHYSCAPIIFFNMGLLKHTLSTYYFRKLVFRFSVFDVFFDVRFLYGIIRFTITALVFK